MELYKRIREEAKQHVVDSTAILTIGTPISAAMEVGLAGMSDEVSINARLIAAGLTYGGFGSIFSRGRDLWRKEFKITDTTREKIQLAHDTAYLTSLNLALNPIFYYVSGSRDWKEIAIGTAAATGLTFLIGGSAGYTLDAIRDLTGVKKSQRVPIKIRNLSPKIKKGLAALILAGSLGLTAGIYGLTNDNSTTDTSAKDSIMGFVQN